MLEKDKIRHSLELKMLIREDGVYEEEAQDLLDFLEAKLHRQMAQYDRKVRQVIERSLEWARDAKVREADLFVLAEQEYRKEFENWENEAASPMDKGLRLILLEWRQA